MNVSDYKTTTLARPDIVDVLMIEPVEMVPVKDANGKVTGYEKKVWQTENGKTRTKYDVHLVQQKPAQVVEDDGTITTEYTQEDIIEQITVIDEGLATEEVAFRKRVREVDLRTEVQKVKAFIPDVETEYLRVENISYDAKDLKVEFTGIKEDPTDGTIVKERVFGWIDATGTPQKRIVKKDANSA